MSNRIEKLREKLKGKRSPSFKDITGLEYGRLRVLYCVTPPGQGRLKWCCQCKCGKIVEVSGHSLRHGDTHSCGCRLSERPHFRTHGRSKEPIYWMWAHLKRRQQVSKEWTGFEQFYADVGDRPPDSVLCRPDPLLPFGPNNYIWVPKYKRGRPRKRAKQIAA